MNQHQTDTYRKFFTDQRWHTTSGPPRETRTERYIPIIEREVEVTVEERLESECCEYEAWPFHCTELQLLSQPKYWVDRRGRVFHILSIEPLYANAILRTLLTKFAVADDPSPPRYLYQLLESPLYQALRRRVGQALID